ncbi:MAG: FtsX-like permease family protein [Fibrobacter sp.]|nr:FtsX-like permease family protein [Fibrobacter sp.]
MPFYLSIAFKNIFRDPRRSITLGINYFFISILLLLVFSITQGVKKNITRNVLTSTAGHITVSGEYIVNGRTYQGIQHYPVVDSITRDAFNGTSVITRYSMSSAVYYKGISKRLSFTGINVSSDNGYKNQIVVNDTGWNNFFREPNTVLIPLSIAEYFGLSVNDELLISTRSRLGAFNTGTIKVAGIFTSGNYFLKDLVISHFDFLQKLDLADRSTASKMFIYFDKPVDIDSKRDILLDKFNKTGFIANKPVSNNDALNAVSAASPRYKVQPGDVNQKRLTLSTADEVTGIVSQVTGAINGLGIFVAAIMLFIISVSIFINMRMTINDRMLEIGTLRAIGCEQNSIVKLFIAENVLLSLLFIGAGIAGGLILMTLGSTFVTLPSNGTIGLFLNQGHPVFEPTILHIVFIPVVLIFFTTLFSYFPARYGGRIQVVTALNKTH